MTAYDLNFNSIHHFAYVSTPIIFGVVDLR
jgi:hypothetical protein